jgi:hypothetical protein
VDLGQLQDISTIRIWNRTDAAPERLSNFYVLVSSEAFQSTNLSATLNQSGVSSYYMAGTAGSPTIFSINRSGRYVRVQLAGTNYLSLAEVEVLTLVNGGESANLRDGLVGQWLLDEGNGTTIADSSGYAHHGSLLNGPTWVNGHLGGKAVNFDGSDDYATNIESSALRLTGDMTLAFWMKKNSEPSNWCRLVGKGDNLNRNYGIWADYQLGLLMFQQYKPDTGWYVNLYSASGTSTGAWYHVAAVVKGTNVYFYLNGLFSSSTTRSGSPPTSADPVTFAYSGYLNHFDGALDDIRIYNRALSSPEMAALANTVTTDKDGDGIPDYLEDANGNGTVDWGETDWNSATDTGLKVLITRPKNNSIIP